MVIRIIFGAAVVLLALVLDVRALSAQTTVDFATFLGGDRRDRIQGLTVAPDGTIVVVGNTSSNNFPATAGAYDTSRNDTFTQDGMVAKISADGSRLIWATYLGGNDRDQVYGVTVGADGSVIVCGTTTSQNFPTTRGAYDRRYNGGSYGDIFVTKLRADGSGLVFSTLIGGSGADHCRGAVVEDSQGNIYFTAQTESRNMPIVGNVVQRTFGGGTHDGYIGKLSSDGSTLLLATYIGGSGSDMAWSGVHLLPDGIVIGGATNSNDMPTTAGAYQTHFQGGGDNSPGKPWWLGGDGWIGKLRYDFSSFEYLTYLGGTNGRDSLLHNHGLKVTAAGEPVALIDTYSNNFPTTAGAYQRTYGGSGDIAVAVLSADGSRLKHSTYLGRSAVDYPSGLFVDSLGRIAFSGMTKSSNFPITNDAAFTTFQTATDAIFVVFDPTLSNLVYSTFFPGSGNDDRGRATWQAGRNSFVFGGISNSSNFYSSQNAYQTVNQGGGDAFLIKVTVGQGTATPTPVLLDHGRRR